jgi:hypothetical protein
MMDSLHGGKGRERWIDKEKRRGFSTRTVEIGISPYPP